MIGFGILIVYAALLFLVYDRLKRKKEINPENISSMIFAAGVNVGEGSLIASAFCAWMWTTSIFAPSETFELYGIWGPLGYVMGACIGFYGCVIVMFAVKKRMREPGTYMNFVKKRYGKVSMIFFCIFGFLVCSYVLVENAVGIASVMEPLFGSSFKGIAFGSVMISMIFVFFGGMKSVLSSEKIFALVIVAGLLLIVFLLLKDDTLWVSRETVHTVKGQSWISDAVIIPAVRYFVIAIVIAFSQTVFDPGYYLKASLIEDTKKAKRAFLIGGIPLWGGLTLAVSLYLGCVSVETGQPIIDTFHGCARIIFAVTITFIGVTTISHYLMGMLGIFSVEFYTSFFRKNPTDKEKIVFGRVMLIAAGVVCALTAISLEGISLLTIDVFCAIFFAGPCCPLIWGLFTHKLFFFIPIIASLIGIIAGLTVWILMVGCSPWAQFCGLMVSLCVPGLIMAIASAVTQE